MERLTLILALLGAASATPVVDYSPQQLHELWAAAAPTAAPVLAGRPGRPPFFIPPWLTAGIGAGGTLPPGWGTGPLTAGAVCGPYTLPVNLPFSPPCPYSTTAVTVSVPTPTTTRIPGPTGPEEPDEPEEPEPTATGPTTTLLPGTTIHKPTVSPTTALPPPRPTDTTTQIIKTLPPTTGPGGSPTQVIVTVSVTLKPDQPIGGASAKAGQATTLSTVRRV